MIWNIAIISFLVVFCLTTFLTLFTPKEKGQVNPLKEYILGGSNLKKSSVVSLLLSSSFGLNAIFLQIYLGFQIGFWSLIVQLAWCISFSLLSKYSNRIKEFRSLHELIGSNSGKATRILAGSLTLIGICFLMAWEFSIGNATIQNAFEYHKQTNGETLSVYLCYAIVGGCLLYTLIGGLKGNAIADALLNLFKIVIFSAMAFLMFKNADSQFIKNLFPSIETMVKNMGWWGLITNIIFSISWQFIDNSTWQNIIAGKEENVQTSKSTLNISGFVIFLVPGLIGTVIGVYLANVNGIDDKNILTQAFVMLKNSTSLSDTVIFSLLFTSIISCMMSLLDGLFLSSSYTLVTDVFFPEKSLDAFTNVERSNNILLILRICLIAIAIVAIWGISTVLKMLNDNIFNYVYLVIVPQLALLGAVVHTLTRPRNITFFPMWSLILTALAVGVSCSLIGSKVESLKWLNDGAGAITAMTSLLLVFLTSKRMG